MESPYTHISTDETSLQDHPIITGDISGGEISKEISDEEPEELGAFESVIIQDVEEGVEEDEQDWPNVVVTSICVQENTFVEPPTSLLSEPALIVVRPSPDLLNPVDEKRHHPVVTMVSPFFRLADITQPDRVTMLASSAGSLVRPGWEIPQRSFASYSIGDMAPVPTTAFIDSTTLNIIDINDGTDSSDLTAVASNSPEKLKQISDQSPIHTPSTPSYQLSEVDGIREVRHFFPSGVLQELLLLSDGHLISKQIFDEENHLLQEIMAEGDLLIGRTFVDDQVSEETHHRDDFLVQKTTYKGPVSIEEKFHKPEADQKSPHSTITIYKGDAVVAQYSKGVSLGFFRVWENEGRQLLWDLQTKNSKLHAMCFAYQNGRERMSGQFNEGRAVGNHIVRVMDEDGQGEVVINLSPEEVDMSFWNHYLRDIERVINRDSGEVSKEISGEGSKDVSDEEVIAMTRSLRQEDRPTQVLDSAPASFVEARLEDQQNDSCEYSHEDAESSDSL